SNPPRECGCMDELYERRPVDGDCGVEHCIVARTSHAVAASQRGLEHKRRNPQGALGPRLVWDNCPGRSPRRQRIVREEAAREAHCTRHGSALCRTEEFAKKKNPGLGKRPECISRGAVVEAPSWTWPRHIDI